MRVENGHVRLYVEVDGDRDAAPVLFLHGISSSARSWTWLPHWLTDGRRIIRLDLRGHGRSDRAPGAYDVAHFGRDVLAILDRLTDRPAVLVGHSLGGVVAWSLAQRDPERVAAVLLVDPPLLLGTPAEFDRSEFRMTFARLRTGIAELRAAELPAPEIAAQIGALPVHRNPLTLLRDTLTDDALDAMGFAFRWLDLAVLDSVLDGSMMSGFDVRAPLAAPALVLAAADGSAFPPRHAEWLAHLHHAVEVVRIPGSGHGIHEERVSRPTFTGYLDKFLAKYATA